MFNRYRKKKKRIIFIRRCRARHEKKIKRERQKNSRCSINYSNKKRIAENKLKRNLINKNHVTLSAPKDFSFISNHDEMAEYFENAYSHIEKGIPVVFDIANIENITIDALMYILTMMNHFTKKNYMYSVSGNLPHKTELKAIVKHSGFLDYMKHRELMDDEVRYEERYCKLKYSDQNDPDVLREIMIFIQKKFGWNNVQTSFVFEAVSEMMYNTVEHAYEKNGTRGRWYVMAHSEKNDEIEVVFLDTGASIPKTVKRNFKEQVNALVGNIFPSFTPSESRIIRSGLDGAFRTKTGKRYRGRGLPAIKEFSRHSNVGSFRIITSKVNMLINDETSEDLDKQYDFRGSLFVWTLNKEACNA